MNTVNKCIYYLRVSSAKQSTGVSFETQKSICDIHRKKNNWVLSKCVRDIHTAYGSISEQLISVLNSRDKNILFYDVSRYCRQVEEGIHMATSCVQNGNCMIFCNEKIVLNDRTNKYVWDSFRQYLIQANNESATIGRRIRDTKKSMSNLGKYNGGKIQYGYKLYTDIDGNKYLEHDNNEMLILRLIDNLKNGNKIESERVLKSCIDGGIDYGIDDNYGIKEHMSGSEIATFLNKLNITRRGKKWTKTMIFTVLCGIKRDEVKKYHNDDTIEVNDHMKKKRKISPRDDNLDTTNIDLKHNGSDCIASVSEIIDPVVIDNIANNMGYELDIFHDGVGITYAKDIVEMSTFDKFTSVMKKNNIPERQMDKYIDMLGQLITLSKNI